MEPRKRFKLEFSSKGISEHFSGKSISEILADIHHPDFHFGHVDYNTKTGKGHLSVYTHLDLNTTLLYFKKALGGTVKEMDSTCNN